MYDKFVSLTSKASLFRDKFRLVRLRNNDFRESCTQVLAITAALILLPFGLLDAINGNYILSVAIVIVALAFIAMAWKIHNNQYNPTYIDVLAVPGLISALILAFHFLGLKGALWAYPSIIVFYMVLSERVAWLANTILVVVISYQSFTQLAPDLAIRLVVTLLVVSMFIAIFVDIIIQQQEKLHTLAETDWLTGLLNRSTMKQVLQRAIAEAERANIPVAMIQTDLDFFKKVNDTYGHAMGDKTLQAFARLMLKKTRKTDNVFRMGGEEFMILLFNTDLNGSISLAEELRSAVAYDSNIKTTASFGVSIHNKGEDFETWIIRTDELLYKAKAMGRNRVVR